MKLVHVTLICLVITSALLGAGCKQSAATPPVPAVNEPEPLVFASSTPVPEETTTTIKIGAINYSVEAVKDAEGTVKNFTVKKDGKVWKSVVAGLGETGVHIFKQTKRYVYLAPELDISNGYILFEATPTRLIRVDIANGDQKVFQLGGVAEDISADDKYILWIVAGQGSLNFSILDTTTGKRTLTVPVEKQFSQAGNARFSPDTKKFAYATAVGIPDRDGGAVVSVDIARKQQVKLVENLHTGQVPHIYGWKTTSTIDYRFE